MTYNSICIISVVTVFITFITCGPSSTVDSVWPVTLHLEQGGESRQAHFTLCQDRHTCHSVKIGTLKSQTRQANLTLSQDRHTSHSVKTITIHTQLRHAHFTLSPNRQNPHSIKTRTLHTQSRKVYPILCQANLKLSQDMHTSHSL